jgi:hypothetical protein
MELHLKIIGWLLIALSLVHVGFPRYFNWKKELKQLQLVNKQVMEVHTFFIALVVLMMGVLCLTISPDEIESPVGKKVMLGLFVFWFLRLCIQFFWYSPKLWRGRRFETAVHIVFSILWTYLSVVFFSLWQTGAH